MNHVSFEIGTGEIVGFLGPNGAGKSTTMKMITGYIPPTEGGGTVCGIDFVEESIEVRKIIGYLPEHNPLYLDMYVKEYLAFLLGFRFFVLYRLFTLCHFFLPFLNLNLL